MAKVTIEDIDVMCVVAEGGPAGGPVAFGTLEAAVGSMQGRRFYATYHDGEYRACVALQQSDDPAGVGLTTWRIPGGTYEQRKLRNWQDHLDEIGATFDAMASDEEVDRSRPSIEYYRSSRELILLLPVR